MTVTCSDEERRALVRAHTDADGRPDRYGLDYLEVSDDELTLFVYFLGKLPPALVSDPHLQTRVRIAGGQRITGIQVVSVSLHPDPNPERDDYLQVRVDRSGDFSTYSLHLVDVAGVDPLCATLDFSFKVGCPTDLDCAATHTCPPRLYQQPDISYLAKDYASFRQIILDRLSASMPDWRERHVPDIGIALVELLAYVGDYLSYYQDAVATEAYLDTARQRVSVRRHARLVDYSLHEGYNARSWVLLQVGEDMPLQLAEVSFLAGLKGLVASLDPFVPIQQLQQFGAGSFEVFEPLAPNGATTLQLYNAHNEISLYTWGDRLCCLPQGATRATLRDRWSIGSTSTYDQSPTRMLNLRAGDFLLFEEVRGPRTGVPGDADPTHRHVVRLTRVEAHQDDLVTESDSNMPIPVLEVEWATVDALPFALCISAIGQPPDCIYYDAVSVARGNILLVDQGQKVDQELPPIPLVEVGGCCECAGHPVDIEARAGRYTPSLEFGPLVFAQPVTGCQPASQLVQQDAHRAAAEVRLTSTTTDDQPPIDWTVRMDLLGSGPDDPGFVVEMDDARDARLRFGDGELGQSLTVGAVIHAWYRVARTSIAHFGAGAIANITTGKGMLAHIQQVRNPLAAVGPLGPQSIAEAKLLAPGAFKRLIQRAITADDYAQVVERELKSRIQGAAAELVWSGSWYEADVALDPLRSDDPGAPLLDCAQDVLDGYRRVGQDLRVEKAVYVPIDLALLVCVQPNYLRGYVEAALLDVLSNRLLPGGGSGLFHPDNITFGQALYTSRIIAATQAVQGVESVQITRFQRLFEVANNELHQGYLPLGRFEIAQLDNDPSFPERGRLTLEVRGGR